MRNFDLAADIQEKKDFDDLSIDEACLAVFEEIDGTERALDPRTLRNMYMRETKHPVDKAAVKAWVETRRLSRGESL